MQDKCNIADIKEMLHYNFYLKIVITLRPNS